MTNGARIAFALAFVTRQNELDAAARALAKAAEGDAVVWFACSKYAMSKAGKKKAAKRTK